MASGPTSERELCVFLQEVQGQEDLDTRQASRIMEKNDTQRFDHVAHRTRIEKDPIRIVWKSELF